MVQTKGQIIENSNLLFRLHHQRFYPKEVVTMFITYLYTFVNNGIIVSKSPLSVNF